MKKILALGIIFTLILSISVGCQPDDNITYKDGDYTAETEFDDHGWKGIITISVEDEKITNVEYDEFDELENKKSEDEEYGKSMENASGIKPEDAYSQLEKSLVENQDPDKIDIVAGATTSSETFKDLAKKALNK